MPILDNNGTGITLRAKHTDSLGNFSENYAEASISTTTVPYVSMYAYMGGDASGEPYYRNFNPSFVAKNTLAKIEIDSTSDTPNITPILTFGGDIIELNCVMANQGTDTVIYRCVRTNIKGNEYTTFERQVFHPDTMLVTESNIIDFQSNTDILNFNTISAMVHTNDAVFLVSSGTSVYSVDFTARTYTLLSSPGEIFGFAWATSELGKIYYAINNTQLIPIDIYGATSSGIYLVPVDNSYVIDSVICAATGNDGITYAIISYNGYGSLLSTIDLNTSDVTVLSLQSMSDFKSLAFLNNLIIGYTKVESEVYESGAIYSIVVDEELTITKLHRFSNLTDENARINSNIIDGHIYRLVNKTQYGVPGQDEEAYTQRVILEKVNPYNLIVEEIELSGYVSDNADGITNIAVPKAMCFDPVTSAFYIIVDTDDDWHNELIKVTTSGVASYVDNSSNFFYGECRGLATVRKTLWGVDGFDSYMLKFKKTNGHIINANEVKTSDYINNASNFRALTSYGPYLAGSVAVDGGYKIAVIDPLIPSNGEEPNGDLRCFIHESYNSLAAEIIPTVPAMYFASGNSTGTFRQNTIYRFDQTQGQKIDTIKHLFPNWMEYTSAMTYVGRHLWRLSRVSESDGNIEDMTYLEKIDVVTREREFIPAPYYELENFMARSMIWLKDQACFLALNSSAAIKFDRYGHTLGGVSGMISFPSDPVGIFYKTIDDVEYLYVILQNGGLVALQNDGGIVAEDIVVVTAPGWTISTVYSAFSTSTEAYVLATLLDHETLPSGIYLCTLNVGTHELAVASDLMPPMTTIAYNIENNCWYGDLQTNYMDGNSNFYPGGMLYKVDFGSNADAWKRISTKGYIVENTIAWNPDNNRLYVTGRYSNYFEDNGGGEGGVESLFFGELNPWTGELIRKDINYNGMTVYTPYAMCCLGNDIFLISDNYTLTIMSKEGIVITQYAGGNWAGFANVDGVIYGVKYDSTHLFTIDPNSETFEATDLGEIVGDESNTGYRALVYHEGVMFVSSLTGGPYGLFGELNLETRVHDVYGPLPFEFYNYASGLGPEITSPPPGGYFWDYFNSGKIAVQMNFEGEVDIVNMEAEVAPHNNLANDNNPSDIGWKRVKILGYENGFIKLDYPCLNITVRLRYRNPNSEWTYCYLD